MKPVHIKARPEDIADTVLVFGDPNRTKVVSQILDEPRLVNDYRGYLTYTGTWKGKTITFSTHGIGAPSAAIVFEELFMLGARTMIRVGTTGGFMKEMRNGDVVVVTGAGYKMGGTLGMYSKYCMPGVPDYILVSKIVEKVSEKRLRYWVGPVFSNDAFHMEEKEFISYLRSRGFISIEMECATLFALAQIRGYKAAAVLVISDVIPEGHPEEEEFAGLEELKDVFLKLTEAVLDAVVEL